MKITKIFVFSLLSVLGGIGSAQAALVAGFDVASYATSLDAVTPQLASLEVVTTGGTLVVVTTDQSIDTFVQLPGNAVNGSIVLTLGFASSSLVNGIGNDLVLFEIGSPDTFSLTINNQSLLALSADTGFTSAGGQVNAAVLDLSAFGVADGATVSSIGIGLDKGGATFALAGALASSVSPVPVPAAVWLFGSGLLGLVGVARRKR